MTYLTEPYKGLTTDFDQDVITIGRAAENDMVVDEVHVSAYHARLLQRESLVFIEDLGSTNGTFVNGKRVKVPTPITPGATIQVGTKTKLKFTPLTEDLGDRTVVGAPQEFPDYVPEPMPQQSFQQPKPKKKSFPAWIIFVVLGIGLLCAGVIVVGGGGIFALNLFNNPERQTAQAMDDYLLQTDQANLENTKVAMTQAPYATGTAQAQATSQAQAQGTATAQAEATAAAIDYYWDIVADAMGTSPLYGPVSGSIAHKDDGNVETSYAGVDYLNSVITVDFYPPYSTDEGKWDMGIFFRDQGRNDEFRLVVESSGYYYLLDQKGEEENYIVEGNLNNVNLGVNTPNSFTLIVWETRGMFFLNGVFIQEFDITSRMIPGDIGVAINVITGNLIVGAETYYEFFTVYALPVQ